MKKLFTALMAVVMLSSVAFAQTNRSARRLAPQEAAKVAVAKSLQKYAPAATAQSAKKNVAVKNGAKTIINTFPYSEGFENGSADWTLIDSDNDGFNWAVASSVGNFNARTGVDCIVSASYDNDGRVALSPDNWMISSQIQLPTSATNFELTWYDAAQDPDYPSETYSVYIATTNTVAGFTATTPVFTTTLTTDAWTKRTVDLSSYAGQNIYVAFRHHNCYDMFFMKLDDIRIGGPSTPEISLAGAVSVRMGDSATYTVSGLGNATLAWSFGGTPSETYSADSTSVTLVWSTAGTFNVIATATNAVGSTSESIEVTVVDCSQLITLPFAASFGNDLGCWNNVSDSTEGTGWFTSAELGLEEGQVASMSAESLFGIIMIDVPVDNWLISPAMEVPTTGGFELAWQVKPYEPTYSGDHYAVYAIANGDTTQLFAETLNANMTDYVQRIASLPASLNGENIQIAFRHFDCEGGYLIIIDSIEVRQLSAPAVSVDGPASVILNAPATFTAVSSNADSYSWTVDGNDASCTASTLNYTFTTAGSHSVEVTATNTVGSSSATMTVNVIAWGDTMFYDDGIFSSAVGTGGEIYWAVKFDAASLANRTYLTNVLVYAYEDGAGTYDVSIYQGGDNAPGTLVTTQSNTVDANHINMWNNFQLYTPVTINANQPLWVVLHSNDIAYPASYSEFCGNYNASYVSLDGAEWDYIQNHSSTLNSTWMVRAVTGDEMPTPTVSISGPATAMAGEEVTFTFHGPVDASYTVDFQGGEFVRATGATVAAPATATGMWNEAGTYTVTVEATNSLGTATATASITIISCDAITSFPYEMGFEAGDDIACWSFVDADGDGYGWDCTQWANSEYTNTGAGAVGSASFINNIGALTPDNWMITPAIQLPAEGGAKISWYVGGVDASFFDENYAVMVSTTGNNPSDFTQTIFDGTVESVDFTEEQASLNAFMGQTIYIAFRHYNSEDIYWMIIDDIEISTNVSINEASEAVVNIYPNPTHNRIVVEGEGIQQIDIIDVNGRTVMSQTKAGAVDMSALANGIYVVRTLTANGVSMQKVIKK